MMFWHFLIAKENKSLVQNFVVGKCVYILAYNVHFTQFFIQGNQCCSLVECRINVSSGINSEKQFIQHWYLSDATESSSIEANQNELILDSENQN